jgi:pimeloyl-ACP methyl ester carboxylesterase
MTEKLITEDEFDTLEEHAGELEVPWEGRPAVVRQESLTPDGRISAVKWGDAPAVSVLLHGRAPTQSARSWDGVALAWGAPLVAVDFPGHGFSASRSDRRYTPRLISPALAEAIDDLVPTPTVLVGVSFGGLTSIALAARSPELVRALVLVDVLPWVAHAVAPADQAPEAPSSADPAPAPPIETFASREEILEGLESNSPRSRSDLERNVAANTRQLDDGRWAWRFDPGVKFSVADIDLPGLWDDLVATSVPVLLVRGGRSPVVSDEAVAALQEKRPDITVATVADSGHEIHDERPRQLATIIEEFQASLS